jgi:hypothetical protein
MTLMIVAVALLAGEATTILIENRSARSVQLSEARLPAHYAPLSRAPLVPQATDRVASTEGKLFVPHDQSGEEAVSLRYVDSEGRGCIFVVDPTPHSASWRKLKPRAHALRDAVCEAWTGRTIGDFVYVIR